MLCRGSTWWTLGFLWRRVHLSESGYMARSYPCGDGRCPRICRYERFEEKSTHIDYLRLASSPCKCHWVPSSSYSIWFELIRFMKTEKKKKVKKKKKLEKKRDRKTRMLLCGLDCFPYSIAFYTFLFYIYIYHFSFLFSIQIINFGTIFSRKSKLIICSNIVRFQSGNEEKPHKS